MSAPITISTRLDLEKLAARMHEQLQSTGNVPETHVQIERDEETVTYQIVLRSGPHNQIQLLTIGKGVHWPKDKREALCTAFGVPDDTHPIFEIVRGWQAIKWTWKRKAEQLSFIVGEAQSKNHYEAA